jgi:Putative peptidoglycan binding domain
VPVLLARLILLWLDYWMIELPLKRLLAVGCVALLAATMSPAVDTKTDGIQTSQAPASASNSATNSPSKTSKSTGTSAHSTSSKSKKSRKSAANRRSHGQLKIDPQRALEIQQALIREHYLTGKPTGVWNDATQQAMQRYQADNNWQSKTTPDARALIKLGLGPDHQHLLNPESAMTSEPQAATGATSSTPASTSDSSKQQK